MIGIWDLSAVVLLNSSKGTHVIPRDLEVFQQLISLSGGSKIEICSDFIRAEFMR